MQQIFRRRRFWPATAVAAAAVTAAAALTLAAGPASSHAPAQQRPLISYGIDDTLPQGPSDPAGLLGVPVRGAQLALGHQLAPAQAKEGTTR